MSDEGRGGYTIVPDLILDVEAQPWISATDVAVYLAARSFTSGDPRSDRYARGYPGAAAVGRKARCSERTARRSLDRWEDRGFLYRRRHRRANAVIVFVDYADMIPVFQAAQEARRDRKAEGPLRDAIAEHERRLEALKYESWSKSAREATPRKRGGGQNLDRSRAATQEVLNRSPEIASRSLTGHQRPQDRPPVTPEPEVVNQTTTREPDSSEKPPEAPLPLTGQTGNDTDPDRQEIVAMVKTLTCTRAMPAAYATEEQRETCIRELRQQVEGWT